MRHDTKKILSLASCAMSLLLILALPCVRADQKGVGPAPKLPRVTSVIPGARARPPSEGHPRDQNVTFLCPVCTLDIVPITGRDGTFGQNA